MPAGATHLPPSLLSTDSSSSTCSRLARAHLPPHFNITGRNISRDRSDRRTPFFHQSSSTVVPGFRLLYSPRISPLSAPRAKLQSRVFRLEHPTFPSTGRIFTLGFTAKGAPLAARRIRILTMTQHAWRTITFGVKGSSYLCVFMYPCKWNHASTEKNVNCGSISPSTTDCSNQLQKWTLPAGSRGCKACVDYCCFIGSKLQLCGRSCTKHRHSSLSSLKILWFSRRMFKPGSYVIRLLLSKHSALMFLFVIYQESRCSKFIHQTANCLSAGNFHHEIFTDTF
jgi:hypothetical protein